MILPFAIQTSHAINGHEHKVCDAKEIKHFHKQEIDCGIYHINIEQNSIDFSSEFNLEISPFFNHNLTYFYQSQYNTPLQLKSSRAPPYFIV